MAKLLIWLKRLWHSVYRPDKVMYIGGSDTLPPPLPRDEESVLLEKLNTGDFQVRQTLIEHNLRLVVYIARRFENTGIHIEDLISIGTIGLIKAVNTFRTDKNIKLATYASRCIENEILMYLRKNGAQRTEVSFEEPLNTDWDGKELLLSDVLGTDSDVSCGPLKRMWTGSCCKRRYRTSVRERGISSPCGLAWEVSRSSPKRRWRIDWGFRRATYHGWRSVSSCDCGENCRK